MEAAYKQQPKGFATKAIHSGQEPENWNSYCVVPAIVTSTTFKQDAPAQHRGFAYARGGNPTRNILEKCLAALDNAKYALTFSSGLGAATCILSLLSSGDHIVVSDDIYGGTSRLMREVTSRLKLEPTFADATDLDAFKTSFKTNTKMVWIESPTNPLLKVIDIKAVCDFVHINKPGVIVVVDNTFLTSYYQRPLELGADINMYSLTKYMNGHSDVMMGAATINDDDLHTRLRFLQNATGIVPSPFDCYQVNRGLKTLAIRMEQHQKNSITIATWLEKHPLVEKVLHPGLPSHPQYELTCRQCYGHSGMMSFYLVGDFEKSKKFLQSLRVFTLAESLGGCESLAGLPCIMTHASVPVEDRKKLGITDNLLRLSVGLEDVEDLIEDLENAFKAIS